MNLVLNLKNKLAVVLSIVLLSTLFAFVGTPVKAEAATDNVSFYYSDNYGFYHGGVEMSRILCKFAVGNLFVRKHN